MTLLEAIAAYEGFGVDPTNRPTRNNNPGNVSYGPFAKSYGGVLEEIPEGYTSKPRYAKFETVEQGWKAMRDLLAKKYYKHTVEEMMNKYAPPSENDTEAYIKFICDKVGCGRNAIVGVLLGDI